MLPRSLHPWPHPQLAFYQMSIVLYSPDRSTPVYFPNDPTNRCVLAYDGSHSPGYRDWLTWTGGVTGTEYSACVYVGIPRSNCVARGGTWFQGKQWFEGLYDKPELCTGVCYSGIALFPSTRGMLKTSVVLTIDQRFANQSSHAPLAFSERSHLVFLRKLARNLWIATMTTVCRRSSHLADCLGCLFFPELLKTLAYDVPCTFTPKACLVNFLKACLEAHQVLT